jgi:hypothetical protein
MTILQTDSFKEEKLKNKGQQIDAGSGNGRLRDELLENHVRAAERHCSGNGSSEMEPCKDSR